MEVEVRKIYSGICAAAGVILLRRQNERGCIVCETEGVCDL